MSCAGVSFLNGSLVVILVEGCLFHSALALLYSTLLCQQPQPTATHESRIAAETLISQPSGWLDAATLFSFPIPSSS